MDGNAGAAASPARGPAAAPDAVRCEAAVVGGGLVGAAIARGLAGRGLSTVILDEGDVAHRASRGNFALVWVQSKGLGMARYGAWTRLSSDAWTPLARELRDETGTDVAHQRPGGFSLTLSEEELEKRQAALVRMHNQPGWIPYASRCWTAPPFCASSLASGRTWRAPCTARWTAT
jgi:glycine/D-amino acid oxidase-like deaminating enzyme